MNLPVCRDRRCCSPPAKAPFTAMSLVVLLLVSPPLVFAQTHVTFTKTDSSQMANMFMVTDSRTLSPLATEQYPSRNGLTYIYFQNASYAASDGDCHIDLAFDSSGTGAHDTCCGSGDSPITAEVLNATQNKPSSDCVHLQSLDTTKTYWEGVFRFRNEHNCTSCFDTGERKFEIHPATKVWKLSGSSYVLDHNYGDSAHLKTVKDGMSHTIYVLEYIFSDTWSATVQSGDSTKVDFTFPNSAVNYAEFKGTVTVASGTDSLGKYFVFHPTDGVVSTSGSSQPMNPPVPSNLDPRVRIVPGSLAESELNALPNGTLTVGSTLNVNALTRVDWSDIDGKIQPLGAGQSLTNQPLKVELVALDLKNIIVR